MSLKQTWGWESEGVGLGEGEGEGLWAEQKMTAAHSRRRTAGRHTPAVFGALLLSACFILGLCDSEPVA